MPAAWCYHQWHIHFQLKAPQGEKNQTQLSGEPFLKTPFLKINSVKNNPPQEDFKKKKKKECTGEKNKNCKRRLYRKKVVI